MRKRRVQSSSAEASYKALRTRSSGRIPSQHFVGLSLSGGKADKSSFALLEYFPDPKKIFLSMLVEQIQNSDGISADLQIHKMIESIPQPIDRIAVDGPLTLPKCFLKCPCKCPGYEKCQEPEIKWMQKYYQKKNTGKKPHRYMTPYTERCVELYIETELEEKFNLHHALGANRAPITARIQFIRRRFKHKFIEVVPKISFWRMGLALGLQKSKLRLHRHWDGGIESRQLFLQALKEKDLAFIYEQDLKILIEDQYAFDAFLCALTGLLSSKKQTEPRPLGFPKSEGWIDFPKLDLKWP